MIDEPKLYEQWRRGEISYREYSIRTGQLKEPTWREKLWDWFWLGMRT